LLRIAAAAFEIQEGVMVTNADQVILRVNQAFTRITGYSAAEAIGRKPSFLSSGRHDRAFYESMWSSVQEDGFWQGEVWDKRKNGEAFPIWLTHTAISGEHDEVTHYVGSFIDITQQKQAEKLLHDARQQLENIVNHTEEELGKSKNEASEYNTAFNVLLKQQKKDKLDAQHELSYELRETVLPFLERLNRSGLDQKQNQLLKIIETNLHHLVTTYGRITHMSAIYQQLTPVEIQVATLIRQGLSTKAIAATLSLSTETIGVHRKHIRKKLALDNAATNLRSYLLSMAE
ncbi:MAG: PAS domain S-box protein, partial [Methylomonas sp.]